MNNVDVLCPDSADNSQKATDCMIKLFQESGLW